MRAGRNASASCSSARARFAPEAVVDARAERQRLRVAAVGRDVERLGIALHAVAITRKRADHHDAVGREGDPAVLHLLVEKPRGERRDRLVAEQLLHRRRRQLRPLGEQRPLVRVLREHAQPVGELRLRRVHAADEHVQHEVHALGVVEPVALVRGRDQGRDEVVAGIVAAALDQSSRPLVELRTGSLERLALVREAVRVELALDQVRPLVQLRRVVERRAHHGRDRERRVRLREVADELAAAGVLERRPEALEEVAHRGPPAVGRARGERRVHEVAQPPVGVAVDVEDVAPHLLEERPLLHAEHLGDPKSREGRALRAQEERARLAVEHEPAELGLREPGLAAQGIDRLVKARAREIGREIVELHWPGGRYPG